MLDAISRAAWRIGGYYMSPILPYIVTLFSKPSAPSLNRAIVLALPHVYRSDLLTSKETTVMKWAAAAMEVPYTEDTGLAVVDTLLYAASNNSLRSCIPVGVWKRLKNISSPTSVIHIRKGRGSSPDIVRYVRGLGDIEILTSYFLLVLSERNVRNDIHEVEISMREDFSGIGMWGHRGDLVKRLDYVLGQLGRGLEYLKLEQYSPQFWDESRVELAKEQYQKLKEVLLEVDKDAMDTLTGAPSRYLFSTSLF